MRWEALGTDRRQRLKTCALRGEERVRASSTSVIPNPGGGLRTDLEDPDETPGSFEVARPWVEPAHAVVLDLETPVVAFKVMTHLSCHALDQRSAESPAVCQSLRRPDPLQREAATMKELAKCVGLLLVVGTRADDDLSQTIGGVEPRFPKPQESRNLPTLFERYAVWLHT